MFSKAYEIASEFTQPLIISVRYFDKTIESGFGTYIVLNKEGWLMTAAHNLLGFVALEQHKKESAEYEQKRKEIIGNIKLKEHQRKIALKHLRPNSKWVTNIFLWLIGDGVKIEENHYYAENDIAFIRIDKKYITALKGFPKIKNPENLKPGTSLCKLGFPFYEIKATFNEDTQLFQFPPNTLPAPRFPIEGIYTRNLLAGKTEDGSMDILYLETSSPGLKGQSGGPIFDTEGNVWAIQSKNNTISLGFKGEVEIDGKKVVENQFMNVGWGVHPKTIIKLLQKHQIAFEMID